MTALGQNYKISTPPSDLELDPFYKKYCNVNGVPVISSERVPDSAFYQACLIVDFMTSDLPEKVRAEMVKNKAKMGIMAKDEYTTDIPEHAFLKNDTTENWDTRARGLGGDLHGPLTTCAEENLLCYDEDKYYREDIAIHEFAHGVHLLGIAPADKSFNKKLEKMLANMQRQGKYIGTYAGSNIYEYWAEGVQNWFNINTEVEKDDGIHNWVNTREDMLKYDPKLYKLISKYFSDFEDSPSCHSTENRFAK